MVDRKWWALSLVGALGACEVPVPRGAYDAAPINYVDPEEESPDASGPAVIVEYEAGMPVDAGPIDRIDPDAGSLTPEQTRQLKLEGDYLVRADLFDTTTAQRLATTGTVRSRASVMMQMRVTVSASQGLVATERFCYQNYAMTCASGCTEASLSIFAESYPPMWSKLVSRSLTLAPSSLAISGAGNTHALGYDGSQDPALPSEGDARIYTLSSGATGFRTASMVDVPLIGEKECTADVVTRFATSYEGTLGGTVDAPTFEGGTYTLDRDAVAGRQLNYGPNADCRDDGSATVSETKPAVLRFLRAPAEVPTGDDFFSQGCPPLELWESLLRPDAP